MKLNADLSRPAFVDSASLDWVASPSAGVERRMLDRDGDEVARATSLVRYAAGSSFAPHTHGAGEEFLVLDGVFSDESGDYPAGWYVRNPPGSKHTPASDPGAVIFVKLRQMPQEEAKHVRIDTNESSRWQDIAAGRREALLFAAPWEEVRMIDLDAGYQGPAQPYPNGAEFFVVAGDVAASGDVDPAIEGRRCGAGAWIRVPANSTVSLSSEGGARVWRKSGHLG